MKKLIEYIETASNSELDNSVIENWKNKVTILDIGCRLGSYWFDLYKELHFKKIIGIDKYSQKEISDNEGFQSASPISYESYLNHFNRNYTGNESQLTEIQFNQVFVFKKLDIKDFFTTNLFKENSFNLIIAYQFLYLFNKNHAENIINYIQIRMKKGAYLYIYLASEDFKESLFRPQDSPEEERIKFWLSEPELISMIKPLRIIFSNKYEQYRDILCQKI